MGATGQTQETNCADCKRVDGTANDAAVVYRAAAAAYRVATAAHRAADTAWDNARAAAAAHRATHGGDA